MALFFNILLIAYLIAGGIVVNHVFKKHIEEAEKEGSSTGNVCSAMLLLIFIWPFSWMIAKRIKQ